MTTKSGNPEMTSPIPFFWLHIKKSAGATTMKLLKPYYKEVPVKKYCPSFIQSPVELWNDILNNSRTMLGEYQFKRTLLAKEYLYKDNWSSIYSFAFSRKPTSRVISMFYYLFFINNGINRAGMYERLRKSLRYRKILFSTTGMFDTFLDLVEATRQKPNFVSQHFACHTAQMCPDISDEGGICLLTHVYRVECLVKAVTEVFYGCNLQPPNHIDGGIRANNNLGKGSYSPTKGQLKRIETLYGKDFEIYENARSL